LVQFDSYTLAALRSEVEYRSDMLHPPLAAASHSRSRDPDRAQPDPLAQLPLTDYFGAVTHLQPSRHAFPLLDEGGERAQQQQQQQSDEPRSRSATPNCGQGGASRSCESTLRPPLSAGPAEVTSAFWLLLAAGAAALLLLGLLVDGTSTTIAAI
jgi:hypothetical protein